MVALVASDLMHLIAGKLPPGVALTTPDAAVETLVHQMAEAHIDTFLVVEGEVIRGVIRSSDIAKALDNTDARQPAPAPQAPASARAETTAPEPALTLKLRRIETGEKLLGEFESLDDAETWLRERPFGMEVLGVLRPVLSSEQEHRLHQAMRPLDDAEHALQARRDGQDEQKRRTELEELQAQGLESLSIQLTGASAPGEDPSDS